jgi:hypothetical protein
VHGCVAQPQCSLVALLLIGLPVLSVFLAERSGWVAALQLGVLGLIGASWAVAILEDRPPGLCPYFERPLGAAKTYAHGKALGQRFPELDTWAEGLGVRPVASYGFADDLRGETLVWHDPLEGLMTFRLLLERLEELDREEDAELRDDLRRVVDALRAAAAEEVRFCLVLAAGYTCAREHEVRQGSFF